jgi:hypothetical protein
VVHISQGMGSQMTPGREGRQTGLSLYAAILPETWDQGRDKNSTISSSWGQEESLEASRIPAMIPPM